MTYERRRKDKRTDRVAGKREMEMTALATEQQAAAAPKTINATERLGKKDAAATGGAEKTTGDRVDVARETMGMSQAEGASAAYTENQDGTNNP